MADSKKKIRMSIFLVIVMSLLGSGLGLIREALFAAIYGTSEEIEMFLIASTIPILLIPRISKAISSAFIPYYLKDSTIENRKYYTVKKLIDRFAFWTSLSLLAISIIIFQKTNNILFVHSSILSISIYFLIKSSILIAMHNINDSFVKPAFSNFSINLFFLFSIFISYITNEVIWLSVGVSTYAIFQYFFLTITAPYDQELLLDVKNEDNKDFFSLLIPSVMGAISIIIPIMLIRLMAIFLQEGDIASFNYSYLVTSLIPMLFSVSILPVITPRLSIWKNDKRILKKKLKKLFSSVIIFILPIQILVFFISDIIVKLLFDRGAFTSDAFKITSLLISILSITIILRIFSEIYLRYTLAINLEKITLMATRNYIIVALIITPLFIVFMGIRGAAISIVFVEIFNILYYWRKLKKISQY